MVQYVSVNEQLNLFDVHTAILLQNDILSRKFSKKDFYEFEPLIKSNKSDYPYILIKFPETTEEKLDLKRKIVNKTLTQEIILRMDYEARANARLYANQILGQIATAEETYILSGYDESNIQLQGSTPAMINQKDIVEVSFLFSCECTVNL